MAASSQKGTVYLYDVFSSFHRINVVIFSSLVLHFALDCNNTLLILQPNEESSQQLNFTQTKSTKKATSMSTKTKREKETTTTTTKPASQKKTLSPSSQTTLYPPPATTTTATKEDSDIERAGLLLSHEKILALLRSFGEYPPKYRILIWQSLLSLPSIYPYLVAKFEKFGNFGNFGNFATCSSISFLRHFFIRKQRSIRELTAKGYTLRIYRTT